MNNQKQNEELNAVMFQTPHFCAGYISYRIKLNDDPIPPYLLQSTKEHRKWMDGWNHAKYEVNKLLKRNHHEPR